MEQKEIEMKPWEELTLADHFIFEKVMRNEELCKKVLSEILGKEVVRIERSDYEKTMDVRRDAKSIRLDVFISGEEEVYDIEIHNRYYKQLPKRGRYYSDLMDLDLLQKGQEYETLGHSFVIFICTFDLYHLGYYQYTFTYQCHEVDGLEYGDQTTQIILNTKGKKGEVSEDLKVFLQAINGVFSNTAFSVTLKEEVEKVKHSERWRAEYMTWDLELKRQYKDGFTQGEKTGYEKGEKDGFTQGEKSGYEKGEKSGYEKGQRNAQDEILKISQQLKDGIAPEEIAQTFQVSQEYVEKLAQLQGKSNTPQ